MQERKLGKNGPDVSVLGFGAWPIGGAMGDVNDEEAIRAIHRSIELGGTLIDTAESYGNGRSEELVGRAIKDRRDKVFLATKVSGGQGRLGYQRILDACDASLKRLQTGYIDLYQCHWVDPETPVEESMRAMDTLVKAGKIRYVGVSNFGVDLLKRCLTVRHVDSVQPVYNMLQRDIEAEIIPFCREHGIGILAYSPLGKGVLTGKYTPESTFPENDERARMKSYKGEQWERSLAIVEQLKPLAQEWGMTMSQMAIAWVLANPVVTTALVGAKNIQQVEQNIAAGSITLSQEQLTAINRIVGDYRAPLFG